MKKVNIVSYYFYPEINPRAHRAEFLIEYFLLKGFKVNLVIPELQVEEKYGENAYRNLTIIKIPLKKSGINKLTLKNSGGFFEYIKKIIRDLFYVTREKKFYHSFKKYYAQNKIHLDNDFDNQALITNSLPFCCNQIGAYLKQKYPSVTWIAENGDPFTFNEYNVKSPIKFFIEKYVYRNVNFITIPTEIAIKSYEKFVKDTKLIKVIPQSFYLMEKNSVYNVDKSKINLFFGGYFYPGLRDPSTLIKVIDRIISKPLVFHLFGNIVEFEKYLDLLKVKNRDRFKLNSFVSRDEMFSIMKSMNLLINISNTSKNQIPSKLIEYFFSGKEILNISPKQEAFVAEVFNCLNTFEDINTFLNSYVPSNTIIDYETKHIYDFDRIGSLFEELL
jgi:hypothetical protein